MRLGDVVDPATGARIDRVLNSQLKAGFVVRGILPRYLPDPKSCDFASLLEWVNPGVEGRRPAASIESTRTSTTGHTTESQP